MEFEEARSKKMEANPVSVVEALIHINNQLHQHEVDLKNDSLLCFLLGCFSLSFDFVISPFSLTFAGCSWNINLCPTASRFST